jgi:two-component system response regulator FlrC
MGDAAVRRLASHHWPGNVRELKNVVECAVALCASREIQPEDLFLDLDRGEPAVDGAAAGSDPDSDPGTVAGMEQDLILRTLTDMDGNRTRTATKLGISIRTLRNKLNQYREQGVEVPEPKGRLKEPVA